MAVADAQQRISGAEFAEWMVFMAAEAERERAASGKPAEQTAAAPAIRLQSRKAQSDLLRQFFTDLTPKRGTHGQH